MLVISDTTAITNLAAINQLSLLHALYGQIVIPEAVEHELVIPGVSNPGASEVQSQSWIITQAVLDHSLVTRLLAEHEALDIGEAEAIALTVELKADLLLIDDGVGRRIAKERGLVITDLLGSLLEAKERSIISAVRPVLDDLITVAGFYVAPSLYSYICQLANE